MRYGNDEVSASDFYIHSRVARARVRYLVIGKRYGVAVFRRRRHGRTHLYARLVYIPFRRYFNLLFGSVSESVYRVISERIRTFDGSESSVRAYIERFARSVVNYGNALFDYCGIVIGSGISEYLIRLADFRRRYGVFVYVDLYYGVFFIAKQGLGKIFAVDYADKRVRTARAFCVHA